MGATTDHPTVGVVGDVPSDVVDALKDHDAGPVAGSADEVLAADPDWIVAVGEAALLDLVRTGVERPVLPVVAGPGVGSIPRDEAASAVGTVLDGAAREGRRRLVSVQVDGASATGLFDVSVLTAEPAQISEYTIRVDGSRVSSLRADGLVVATPAGSYGYAGDVGGPVIQPETDVVAVVPVAPFVTDAEHWVLALDGLTIEPRREEPVEVVVDDRSWRVVQPGETVRIEAAGHLSLLGVPGSRGFDAAATGLEKL